MADSHLTELSFSSLHLPETLQKGLADASFERCTPIQAQTLPQALAGLDVAGQAQTGTGKTAAFLVAMYARLIRAEPLPLAQSQRAARADRCSNARAGGADPSRRRSARLAHRPDARAGVRRRRLRQAAPSSRAGRRRADGHAGPHHRFRQAARDRPALGAGAGAGRSRSHVRSRLHQRHPLDPAAPAGAGPAPQHAVLGHAVATRAGARLRAHERPDAGAHRAGQDDGRSPCVR